MPTTGMLLTPEEKSRFGPWLEARRVSAGVSKNAVARAIGAESTTRINHYLVEGVVPTPFVLARIADAIEVPIPVALLRAGYLRELIGLLEYVSLDAAHSMREVIVRFALRAFPMNFEKTELPFVGDAVDESDPFMEAAFGIGNDALEAAVAGKIVDNNLSIAAEDLEENRLAPLLRRRRAGMLVDVWAREYDADAYIWVTTGQSLATVFMRAQREGNL